MKKLLLVMAVVTLGFTVSAQTTFGVKAGANFASISGDDTDDLSSRTSFHFGVTAGFSVSDKFSVQPELVYSSQGAKYDDSEGYDGQFKLDYLNIPIMAQIEVSDGFSLEVGPQIGVLLSATDEYESPGDSGEEDIKDYIKSTDIAVGIGFNYAMTSGLNLGARYNLGVSEIMEDNTGKNQNSVLQISIGYSFGN